MESTTSAYLAGLVDAGGSFARRGDPRYTIRLRVPTERSETAEFLLNSARGNTCRRRDGWIWELENVEDLAKLLAAILPYMHEKRESAARVLEFLELAKHTPPRFESRRNAWKSLATPSEDS